MYEIENTDYGVRFKLDGFIREDEAKKWFENMKAALNKTDKGFKVFVDMRAFKPASTEVQQYFVDIQKNFKDHGMSKSVVILDSQVSTMQLKRTAQESGIYKHERYLTSENNPDWEKQAPDWIKNDIDPDGQ